MRLSSISLGNMRRRKGKTLLLAAGLTVGVAMVVALMSITANMKADVEKKLDEYGANIIIAPRSENLSLSYGGVNVTDALYEVEELREEDIPLIKTIENSRNISAVAPKVMGAAKIEGRSFVVVGVDFPSELKIKKWWHLEGAEGHAQGIPLSLNVAPDEVIIGSTVAKSVGIKQGMPIEISGMSFHVKGILKENTSQDDLAVFMDMRKAQGILGKEGKVSLIEVSALCSECPIEDIVSQITAKLPHAKVSAVRQAMTLRMNTVEQFIRFSVAVSVVVLLIGSLIVFVSMMSSVSERTKEIGVLRAIGFRKSHIIKVILIEAFVVSLISGMGGWITGSLAASLLSPERAFMFDPSMMALSGLLAVFIGMSSSAYPAFKASKLEPLEALRYI